MYACNEVMYFVFHFIFLIFIFVILFLLSLSRKFLELSIYGVYNYQDFKQHVGAEISALISISDGLGLSIFCRKMEKARPMKEEIHGKVVYFPPESAFPNFDVLMLEVFFPICTLTSRVNNYFSRQGEL